MAWTKKGNDFLPNISKAELKKLYKKEKHAKAKTRLLAAILRKENKSLSAISFSIQKPVMTVSDWLRTMEKEGISRVYDKKQPGRPGLNKRELKQLRKILEEPPTNQDLPFVIWTTRLVMYFVNNFFNKDYKLRQIRNILAKIKFTTQKPRPEHRKANKKLQEAFKKTSNQELTHLFKQDGRSCFWTKASFQ